MELHLLAGDALRQRTARIGLNVSIFENIGKMSDTAESSERIPRTEYKESSTTLHEGLEQPNFRISVLALAQDNRGKLLQFT
jgi:hypothetical protein